MLHVDKNDEFWDSTAVTSTAISNVIPLASGNVLRNIAAGEPIFLEIWVDVTATASGAATVTFTLESDSTADLATSATVHWTSGVVAKATLVAGYKVIAISLPVEDYEAFLGLRATVATGPLTAGAFSAFLTHSPMSYTNYADGEN